MCGHLRAVLPASLYVKRAPRRELGHEPRAPGSTVCRKAPAFVPQVPSPFSSSRKTATQLPTPAGSAPVTDPHSPAAPGGLGTCLSGSRPAWGTPGMPRTSRPATHPPPPPAAARRRGRARPHGLPTEGAAPGLRASAGRTPAPETTPPPPLIKRKGDGGGGGEEAPFTDVSDHCGQSPAELLGGHFFL